MRAKVHQAGYLVGSAEASAGASVASVVPMPVARMQTINRKRDVKRVSTGKQARMGVINFVVTISPVEHFQVIDDAHPVLTFRGDIDKSKSRSNTSAGQPLNKFTD